ncbi:unnamed protein product, partial [Gongylonema pulchrum]|uniref:IU_nuc_hydro domain-containing protein n=1 Tax=Gongylonema pulchrum TaxID=637853 RepID=A0A183ELL6_9BILA
VPVYKGAAAPLVARTEKNEQASDFFGRDGIGDQPHAFPEIVATDALSFVPDKPAAVALIELFRKTLDVTLICIGLLTNIALALQLDPAFAKMPREVVIMGGNLHGTFLINNSLIICWETPSLTLPLISTIAIL